MRQVDIWYAGSVYSFQLMWFYEAWWGNVCIADIDQSTYTLFSVDGLILKANSPGCAPGPQTSNKQEEVNR